MIGWILSTRGLEINQANVLPFIALPDWEGNFINSLIIHNHYLMPPRDRAPVLVAIALMEAGMAYEDAVEFIRK